jgi:hypothetical protein
MNRNPMHPPSFFLGTDLSRSSFGGRITRANIRDMFDWLRNQVALYKIDRREKKLDAVGNQFFRESKEKQDETIIDNWYDRNSWQYESIRFDRKELLSDILLREVDQLYLPRPQYSDKTKWEAADEDSPYSGRLVLTPEAMMELRGTIRKERQERRATVEFWVKLIGGIITIGTGLAGALIGLAAILKHK